MRLQHEHFRQERLTKQIQMGWQTRFLKEEHRLQIDRRIATALEVILQTGKASSGTDRTTSQGLFSGKLLLKKGVQYYLKKVGER